MMRNYKELYPEILDALVRLPVGVYFIREEKDEKETETKEDR